MPFTADLLKASLQDWNLIITCANYYRKALQLSKALLKERESAVPVPNLYRKSKSCISVRSHRDGPLTPARGICILLPKFSVVVNTECFRLDEAPFAHIYTIVSIILHVTAQCTKIAHSKWVQPFQPRWERITWAKICLSLGECQALLPHFLFQYKNCGSWKMNWWNEVGDGFKICLRIDKQICFGDRTGVTATAYAVVVGATLMRPSQTSANPLTIRRS